MDWTDASGPGPAPGRAAKRPRPEAGTWDYIFWVGLIFSIGLHVLVVLAFLFNLPAHFSSLMDALGLAEPEMAQEAEPEEPVRVSLWGEVPQNTSLAPISEPTSPEAPAEAAPEASAPEQVLDPEAIPLGPKAEEKRVVKKTKTPPPKVAVPKVEKEAPAPVEARPRATAQAPQTRNVYDMMRRTLGRDARAMTMGDPRSRRVDLNASQYYNRIANLICSHWAPLGRNIQGDIIVAYSFTIEPSGRISGIRRVQSSGDAEFDRSVERAIRAASPLPPLPPSFGGRPDYPQFSFSPKNMGRR